MDKQPAVGNGMSTIPYCVRSDHIVRSDHQGCFFSENSLKIMNSGCQISSADFNRLQDEIMEDELSIFHHGQDDFWLQEINKLTTTNSTTSTSMTTTPPPPPPPPQIPSHDQLDYYMVQNLTSSGTFQQLFKGSCSTTYDDYGGNNTDDGISGFFSNCEKTMNNMSKASSWESENYASSYQQQAPAAKNFKYSEDSSTSTAISSKRKKTGGISVNSRCRSNNNLEDYTAEQKKPRIEKQQSSVSCNIDFRQGSNIGAQESDAEAIVHVKAMIYRAAALRPVSLGTEAAVEKPKRRNVKISSDPQTVAARHRREKISERLRVLQKLVPGGSKMDTASMLDEAGNYLKFLKSQVIALENLGKDIYSPPPHPPPPAAAAAAAAATNNITSSSPHSINIIPHSNSTTFQPSFSHALADASLMAVQTLFHEHRSHHCN